MTDDMTPVDSTPPPAPEPAPAPASGPAPAPAPERHRWAGALWWGTVLIAIGAVLLVSQFIPGVQLWRYWPLIVIAVGIRAMFGSSSGHWSLKVAAEGLTVVAVGLVFLGQMLGYLAWDVWFNIFKLWPLLLVALGLEIIGKGMHAEWLRVISSVIVIAGLAYGALVMTSTGGWSFVGPERSSEPFSESVPREVGVTEGTAHVNPGVGEFALDAGNVLASAEGRSPLDLRFDVNTSGDTVDAEIALEGSTIGWVSPESTLDVTLDDKIAWDLEVDTGVSSFDVDLSGLSISSLSFDAGVSEGTITLGSADAVGTRDAVDAVIKGGVSSLTLRVPEGDDIRVRVNTGLSTIDFSGDWDRSDSDGTRTYESPSFNDSGAFWDVQIDAGIGTITVEYY